MNAFQPAVLPHELTVVAYPDATVEAHGFGPDHPYIEGAILPLVGPSGTLLWKRLARQLIDAGGSPVTVDTSDLAGCIGLGAGLAKNSAAARTVGRLVVFDLARQTGRHDNILAVRTAVAPLAQSRLHRLPPSARQLHDRITRTASAPSVRFGLGELAVTPGAIGAMARTGIDPTVLVDRHHHGDWGDVNVDEALANNEAVDGGALLHSIYHLDDAGTVVWVLTAGDRRTTTVTTPDEY